jgi:hypothetical protein
MSQTHAVAARPPQRGSVAGSADPRHRRARTGHAGARSGRRRRDRVPTTASKYAPPPLVTARPFESKVAAGGGGIYDDAPKRKGQQYDGAIGSLSQGERDAAFVRGRQRGGR